MARIPKSIAGFLLTLLIIAPVLGADRTILFSEDFEKPLGERWKPVKFGELTDYRVVRENSNACLKASANSMSSAFATKVEVQPVSGTVIRWRWKISSCPTNGSEDELATFDHTARIFVAFDTFIGPPRTINYVWANRAQTNSVFDHPSSSRSKFIVLESGNAKAGQWVTEERNLTEDWKRLFKNDKPPKIVGLGVFTDSDGTRTSVTGWYDDIVIERVN
ncbi:MAG TPA: DUF3047 domain-containing protein [Verrucomicrobiae bacterium]|nr:DUF3047 domain-containing protein [Verrucomicrobiae bacterium]